MFAGRKDTYNEWSNKARNAAGGQPSLSPLLIKKKSK